MSDYGFIHAVRSCKVAANYFVWRTHIPIPLDLMHQVEDLYLLVTPSANPSIFLWNIEDHLPLNLHESSDEDAETDLIAEDFINPDNEGGDD